MNTTIPADRFERLITLHRFVRGEDADHARRTAQQGMLIAAGVLTDPPVIVEKIAVCRPRVAPYRHAGESDLWWVSIDVRATVLALTADTATEAAHQLLTVAAEETGADAFEYEVQVWGSRNHEPQLRAA